MPSLLAVLLVVLVLGFLALAWYFNADAVTRRRLRAAPLTTTADVRHGALIRVTGTVQPGEGLLEGPFSRTSCAWWHAVVEEYHQSGKSGHWHTVITEEQSVDFVLRDSAGEAIVRMAGAKVASLPNARSRSGTFDDATPVEEGFLRRHGRESTGLLGFNRSLRYTERALEVGETVTVLGRARQEQIGGRKRLVLVADGENGILLSDDARVTG
jgi:hypothetical protein